MRSRILHMIFMALLGAAGLGSSALADACVGDANGDGRITADEILLVIEADLYGCGAPAAPPTACPGDVNGDGRVLVDEALRVVSSAASGIGATPTATAGSGASATPTAPPITPSSPTPTPSPTASVPATQSSSATPTPTPSATPTGTVRTCPYSFADHLPAETSCFYAGPFSDAPDCPTDLIAAFVSDGTSVLAQLNTTPTVSFGATMSTATLATLVFYVVEGEPVQPLSGTMELRDERRTLIIAPDTPPEIGGIGGAQCTFELYSGMFTQVFAGGQPGLLITLPAAGRADVLASTVSKGLRRDAFNSWPASASAAWPKPGPCRPGSTSLSSPHRNT